MCTGRPRSQSSTPPPSLHDMWTPGLSRCQGGPISQPICLPQPIGQRGSASPAKRATLLSQARWPHASAPPSPSFLLPVTVDDWDSPRGHLIAKIIEFPAWQTDFEPLQRIETPFVSFFSSMHCLFALALPLSHRLDLTGATLARRHCSRFLLLQRR